MGRLLAFTGSAIITIFFLVNDSPLFKAVDNLRDSNAGEETASETKPIKQGRLPSNVQAAIDQSNADAQRQFDEVRAYANAQLMGATNTARGATPRLGKSRRSGRKSAKSGNITSNPYLESDD